MPGMNGEQTFEKLKEIRPDVRVILCSGYSLNGQAAVIMAKGCIAFLQKPFLISGLSRAVRGAVTGVGRAPPPGRPAAEPGMLWDDVPRRLFSGRRDQVRARHGAPCGSVMARPRPSQVSRQSRGWDSGAFRAA
jgi:ActR/RegA family two-component response regulator